MDWIKNLKPGDKVAIKQNYFGETLYHIETVRNITKAGKVRLEDNTLYDRAGRGHHELGQSWDIVQITDSVLLSRKKRGLVNRLRKTDFSKVGLSKLERILKIIEE